MAKFFLYIYSFFKDHRGVMWTVIVSTTLLFAAFAAQLRFDEDIFSLLPHVDRSAESSLAFSQLSIKDKLIIQVTSRDTAASVDPSVLSEAADEFAETFIAADSQSHYIAHTLYRLEEEWMLNGIDYALAQLPTLVDTGAYCAFDSLLTPSALDQRMALNAELLDNDETGNLSMLVSYDPAGLRYGLLPQISGSAVNYIFLQGHLFTRDSSTALIFVAPSFSSQRSGDCGKMVRMLDKVVDQFEATHPDLMVLHHGITDISAGNSNRIKSDIASTIVFSLVLLLILLLVILGHRSSWRHLLFPIIYGTLFSMACLYWIKGSISLMALGIGVLVLGIALSYVLHVIIHHKYLGDCEAVISEQSKPIVLSCLTTIGAFLSMLFTDSALLADFGLFASLALLGTTFFSLTFLPQFLNEENRKYNQRAFRLLNAIGSYPLDRKPVVLIIIMLICVVAFIASPKVGFDSDLNHIGYFSPRVLQSQQYYNQKVNRGYQSVYYGASSTDLEEAMLRSRRLNHALDSLEQLGLVHGHSDISKFCLTLEEQDRNIAAWYRYWTPQREARVQRDINQSAAAHQLDPSLFDPFIALLESAYEPDLLLQSDALPIELSSNFMEQIDSNYILFTSALVTPGTDDSISDILTPLPGVMVADPYYYTGSLVDMVHDNFNLVMFISMIFVFLVLLLSFRSLSVAILAFLPMLISWYVVQGIMAIFGIDFNLLNIILSSFIFGVGVDYSIFTVSGLLAQNRGGNPQSLLYHRTAIVLSALLLVVVSISLLFTVHPAINSVGGCTLIGMLSAILLAFCMQPWIFRQMLKVPFFRKNIDRIS